MRKRTDFIYTVLLFGISLIFAISCKKDDNTNKGGNTFTDIRDGNVYRTVTIGTQIWMAENLRYLPSVVGPGIGSMTTPYYYVYGYNGTNVNDAKATSNYTTYGVLYNWGAAKAAVPAGWHLPTEAEWIQLTTYLGGENIAGDKLKETGSMHWNNPNTGANNETSFTSLPGGFRGINDSFNGVGYGGHWWSATEYGTQGAGAGHIYFDDSNVYIQSDAKEEGFSVRCIKD